jgi:branched-chain amino acid transport system substrate-binding protein
MRIVSSLPHKGYAAVQSKVIDQAIDLAVQQRSATAGVWRVEHLALDDSDDETGDWSPTKEAANAQQAVSDPSVVAYIGPYNSGATMVSLPITSRAGLLQASPSATWPGLTQVDWNDGEPSMYYPTGQRNFVRMVPPDSIQADAAVQWALATNATHIAVLTDGSSYSIGLAQRFESAARGHAELAGDRIEISPPALDGLRDELASYKALFYAPSTAQNAVSLAKALEGTNITIFATDTALDPQFAANAPDAQNWLILSNNVDPGVDAAAQEFARDFEAKYGAAPSHLAANAYDLTNLVLDGVTTSGDDRAAITKAVLATAGYQGASGTVSFDAETGDRTEWRVSAYRLVDGAFKLVETFAGPLSP